MFLNRVFRQERSNRFLWFLAPLIKNGATLRKWYLFSCRFKNVWDIGIFLKPSFYKNCQKLRNSTTDFFLLLQQTSLRALYFYICKFEVNRDRRTRCTKCWSSLTFECNANTFVNVDTQIEEEWRWTISPFCKSILAQSFTATNWVIRNLRRKQFAIQGEQLYAEWGARLMNFHSSNLLCICLSLFETVKCYQIQSSKFDLRFYTCSLVRRPERF